MLAQDVHPNRLGRAKADIRDLIADLRGDRAAILAFRQTAALLCPLTTDTAFLLQTVENLSPDRAPAGPTDLAAAIHASLDALDPVQDEFNAILLISDGEELTGSSLAAAQLAAKRNIPIFTVGIGDPAGAPIPDGSGGFLQHKGETVRSALDENSLRAIASASGGKYIPLATAGTAHTTLGSIYSNHLRTLAAREQQETRERQIQERYNLFLIPALMFLLGAICLSRGRLAAARNNAQCTMHNAQFGNEKDRKKSGKKLCIVHCALCIGNLFALSAHAATPAHLFNAALDSLKTNNTEAARAHLLELSLDPKLGPRANDLLALVTLNEPATNAAQRLGALTAAADRLQQSLRAAPNPARGQNFARVAPLIPRAREEARVEKLLALHGETPPPQLAAQLLAGQREILRAAPGVFTREPADLISGSERLAQRQRGNADLWLPLKPLLLQSVTNPVERAEYESLIEHARAAMDDAAAQFDDLDPVSVETAALAETLPYRLWFMTAEPPALLDENILVQTNALASGGAPLFAARPDQPEAHRLTQRFRQVFPEWAEQMLQQTAADTNMVFTAEDRDEIEHLAAETEDLQYQATLKSDPNRPDLQNRALQNLHRIKELLPRQKQQQNQQQPQNQDEQQQEQEPQNQEADPDDQNEEKQEDQPEKEYSLDPQTAEKIRDMLRRALEREQEHEAEKLKKRQSKPVDGPDW